MAKLATGHRARSAQHLQTAHARSARDVTDLRTRLLYSYIADTTDAKVVAAR